MRRALALTGAILALPGAATAATDATGASYRPGNPPQICSGDSFADQIGTGKRDVLGAARRAERLWGLAGADLLTGSSTRATCLFGGRDNDELGLAGGGGAAFGEHGADALTGSLLDDLLDGGDGNDAIEGGAGADWLLGGAGVDGLEGGEGDDLVDSADGRAEVVDCGEGADLVAADRSDVLLGCERPSVQGGPLHTLRPVPRAARDDEIVRVRLRLPEAAGAGAYRLLLADAPGGPGCPAAGVELGRFPDVGQRVNRGRTVRIGVRPPEGGWCAGQVGVAVVLARRCASKRSCTAPPPAEAIARLSFRAVG